MKQHRNLTLIIVVLLALTVVENAAAGKNTNPTKVIPAYTVIQVMLDDPVSSKTSKAGDKIDSRCTGSNCGGFPTNTVFVAVLTQVSPKHGDTPGMIKGKFTQAVLPDGTSVAIEAVRSTAEGVLVSGASVGKKAKSEARSKGATLGAAAGLIFGGDKFESTLKGAALGYGVGALVKGKSKDVEAKPGAKYYIMLTKQVNIPANSP